MKILKFSLGQLQANCYLIIKDNKCLIFDPGDSADFISEKIITLKLKPLGIFATHGHFDHILAVGELQRIFDIPFYLPKKDFFIFKRAKETADYYLKINSETVDPKKINFLINKKIKISNFLFKVIDTPGHTPGAVCYYFEEENFLLTGDTIFNNGVGRFDFSYSSKRDLKKSLNKLFKLQIKTVIYPGHGDLTTIKEEKNRNLI